MALRADERRDKLRKAAGRSKYLMIRRYLNGETHMRKTHVSWLPDKKKEKLKGFHINIIIIYNDKAGFYQ